MNNETNQPIEIKISQTVYKIERNFTGKETLRKILERLILEQK